jgi:CheY-like chemotaxis protein
MSDELLFSLRVVVASPSPGDRDLFRQAAAAAAVPIEVFEADSLAAVSRLVVSGADLAFFDTAFGNEALAKMVSTSRIAAKPPFTIQLCLPGAHPPFQTDALADKPAELEDAMRLMGSAIGVRLPCRVLVVDDSSTMRSIVRKILAATRFPLEVTEAEQGGEAIELARESEFAVAFVDQHLPGLSGLETIGEIRREQRNPTFVLMTSATDAAFVTQARAHGVGYLKKPFFPADMENVLCGFYGLRALNPKRA